MSLPSKKKSSRREDHRRLATYKVNNCQSARLRITSGQLSAFVRYIEGSNSCQFGIVRLCTLQLDTLHPNPNLPIEKSTLIRFAAKLGRDGIVASLMRGGADPTAFSCLCNTSTNVSLENSSDGVNGASELLSASVRKLLASIPSPLAVYIIRHMVLKRAKYVSLITSIARQKRQGEFWSKNEVTENIPGIGMTCEICNPAECTNKERQIKHPPLCRGQCSLLVMDGCNHIICESCFWQCAVVWVPPIGGHVTGKGEGDGGDIVCPLCTPSETSSDAGHLINESDRSSFIPVSRISPDEVEASNLRFKALPECLPLSLAEGASPKRTGSKLKKSKFKALPRSSIARIQLGTIQSQRSEELLKASARGLNTRIRALFEAGIDIEAVNEYGQSPLFLAAAHRQTHTVSLLCSMGADRGVRDNAGVAVEFSSARDKEDCDGVISMAACSSSSSSSPTSSSCLSRNRTAAVSETETETETETACDSGIRSSSRSRSRVPVGMSGHSDSDSDSDSCGDRDRDRDRESKSKSKSKSKSPFGPIGIETCTDQRDGGAICRVSYILRAPSYSLQERGNRLDSEDHDADNDDGDDGDGDVARINLKSLSMSQSMSQSMSRAVITRLIPADSPHAGASALYIDHAFSEHFLAQLEGLLAVLPTAAPERGATECASRSYFCDATGWVVSGIAEALRCLQSGPDLNGQALRAAKDADADTAVHGDTVCHANRRTDEDSGLREGEGEVDSTCSSSDSDGDNDNYPPYGSDSEQEVSGAPHTREPSSSGRYRAPVREALAHMRFLTYSHAGSCSPPHTDLSRRTQDGRCSTHTFLLYLTNCESGGETRLLRSVNPKNRAVVAISDGKGCVSGRGEDGEGVTVGTGSGVVSLGATATTSAVSNVLATIRPRRGRVLIFPHCCPHEGRAADSLPKILLRGEMI